MMLCFNKMLGLKIFKSNLNLFFKAQIVTTLNGKRKLIAASVQSKRPLKSATLKTGKKISNPINQSANRNEAKYRKLNRSMVDKHDWPKSKDSSMLHSISHNTDKSQLNLGVQFADSVDSHLSSHKNLSKADDELQKGQAVSEFKGEREREDAQDFGRTEQQTETASSALPSDEDAIHFNSPGIVPAEDYDEEEPPSETVQDQQQLDEMLLSKLKQRVSFMLDSSQNNVTKLLLSQIVSESSPVNNEVSLKRMATELAAKDLFFQQMWHHVKQLEKNQKSHHQSSVSNSNPIGANHEKTTTIETTLEAPITTQASVKAMPEKQISQVIHQNVTNAEPNVRTSKMIGKNELHKNANDPMPEIDGVDKTSDRTMSEVNVSQLLAESMPSVQVLVQSVPLTDKSNGFVSQVPFLVIKSVSKIPLVSPGVALEFKPANGTPNLNRNELLNAFVQPDISHSTVEPMLSESRASSAVVQSIPKSKSNHSSNEYQVYGRRKSSSIFKV